MQIDENTKTDRLPYGIVRLPSAQQSQPQTKPSLKHHFKIRPFFIFTILFIAAITTASTLYVSAWQNKKFAIVNKNIIATVSSPDSKLGSVVLGRPTDVSISANVVVANDWQATLEYGTQKGQYGTQKEVVPKDNKPVSVTIDGLSPDTQYYYRLLYRLPKQNEYISSPEYKFHTQRPKGSTFSFVVQSDGHFDESDKKIYGVTNQNELKTSPDFMLDLGDRYMTSTSATTYKDTLTRFAKVREAFNAVGGSTPIFMANGNHDGENGWTNDGTSENIAVWSTNIRKMYFDNPIPNHFYSGNTTSDKYVGQRQNYYSWQWGDALFVVLDAFWYTPTIGLKNGEYDVGSFTIGDQQYQWLKGVLEKGDAKYKFVFSHHLQGLVHGGAYNTYYYEWGGNGQAEDIDWSFQAQRLGWATPIHQLMVQNKVNAFFEGHDHFYAAENRDGIIYQGVPQASLVRVRNFYWPEFDGTKTDESPGFIKVTVSPSGALVDFIKTYEHADGQPDPKNGTPIYSYTIKPN